MQRAKILEVIVCSLSDAIEAQEGGADRLEVVRDLEHGGLTPNLDLVREIAAAVHIPIRVMLRENSSMQLKDKDELEILRRKASEINNLKVDGLVAGFITGDEVDLATLHTITSAAPGIKITFHRAFDVLSDRIRAIGVLKTVSNVDRILTTGEPGAWPERRRRLHQWQSCAEPEITILAGAGLSTAVLSDLWRDPLLSEIHIGRAARIPQETGGKVSRNQVAQLKGSSA